MSSWERSTIVRWLLESCPGSGLEQEETRTIWILSSGLMDRWWTMKAGGRMSPIMRMVSSTVSFLAGELEQPGTMELVILLDISSVKNNHIMHWQFHWYHDLSFAQIKQMIIGFTNSCLNFYCNLHWMIMKNKTTFLFNVRVQQDFLRWATN